jgi:hypothetical protein
MRAAVVDVEPLDGEHRRAGGRGGSLAPGHQCRPPM